VENVASTTAIFGPESDPGRGREEDYRVLLDHLANDVVFEVTIPEGTPISGVFRGKQAVAGCFARLGSIAVFHQERSQRYIADGDRVIVLGDDSCEIRKNGVTARSEHATVVTFRDGLITSILIVLDLSALAEACLA
jgi:hypothetical protein